MFDPLAAMNTATHRVLLIGSLLGAACNPPEPDAPAPPPVVNAPKAPPTGMPAIRAAVIERLEGEVRELAPAGHYTYLRVGEPGDWAVVMGHVEVSLGDAISLRVQGSQDDFHSRRLGRDFERLYFASVAPPKAAT